MDRAPSPGPIAVRGPLVAGEGAPPDGEQANEKGSRASSAAERSLMEIDLRCRGV